MRYILVWLMMFAISVPAMADDHDHDHDHDDAEEEKAELRSLEEILESNLPGDVVYGAEDADVRVVEYASLSCGHCKSFYDDVFSSLKEDYLDNEKITFVYRHFPLNAPAFRAAQLVNCADTDVRKKAFIRALFNSQSEWAFEPDEAKFIAKLQTLAKIGGLSEDEFLACFENKEQEEEMLALQLEAAEVLEITGTPTVFIDDEKVMLRSTDTIKKAIDAELADD